MIKTCLTIIFIFMSSLTLSAENLEFKSKLFKKGTLLFSDDFNEGKYKGRYGPNKKNIKQLEDGTLQVLPMSQDGKRITVHIYNVPKKFVCHLRYKIISSKDSSVGAGMQIGGHKMHLGSTKDGYNLFLRSARKSFKNTEVKGFKANEWIDMVIEYQEGKMLLKINGNEKVFEHEGVNMDGAKSIVFKNGAERVLFDYVRLWEAK